MASKQIVLFDLPTKEPCITWSPNPWKTRLLLNFKGIDYRTQWVEYPDVKPVLEKHVLPNSAGFPYSIPAIHLPDGTYMMDSRQIANSIEERYPEPPLHLNSEYLPKVESVWLRLMDSIRPLFIPQVPKRLLNERSLDYWYTTREEMFGMSLDQLEKEQGGDKAWDKAEPKIREATALLKENQGPFFMGEVISYADLVWTSILLFQKRMGPDFFDELLKRSGDPQVHLKLLEAVSPYA
ncbi:putative glutathione S-transferase [Aspergillus heteromorphus CBS 117.55]|uniref:Putative glutathione S-transferase n=1 Tax=Aspergillus heteromorphus CBS 117.55 TaxID=1448321 RepID=A0A317W929_9EURO|nr:putative glutathione S-transferase [Aspergillus heteromorphus CBS 117.55]PWY80630.1 putative glutathione S-transferase [Aspergillus heteromorphus CBS 117.55]